MHNSDSVLGYSIGGALYCCASFSVYTKSQAKHDPTMWRLLLWPTFAFTAEEKYKRQAYQRQIFKNSRLWESRKFKYDSMIYVSSVNVSRDVNINNSAARYPLQAGPRSELVYFRHQCWLKCKPRGPLSVGSMHKCKVVLGDGWLGLCFRCKR